MSAPARARMGGEEFETICTAVENTGAFGQMLKVAAEARRAREAEARLERIIEDAPHGALCKRGPNNLYDPGGKCTCWKHAVMERNP